MTPESRFHSIVVGLTTSAMFAILSWTLPRLPAQGSHHYVIGLLISFSASAGTYAMLSKGLVLLLNRQRWVKALILGPSFMEGTWAGYYFGQDGKVRYVVETFEQTLNTLVMKGTGYTETGDLSARWSTQAASVDPISGRLVHAYECKFRSKSVSTEGVGDFRMTRKNVHTKPTWIEGFVADLADGQRLPVKEKKITSEILAHKDALEQARGVYKADHP